MSVVRTFFGSCLVLVTLSFATIHAEQFEFTLHDCHIKKDLARLGLNLDQEWRSIFDADGNFQEDKHSELLEKINTIITDVTIEPPSFQIPSTAQNFSTIFKRLNYENISYIYENDKSNKENFNTLLKKNHIQKVINFYIKDSVDVKKLYQEIIAAISTYINQEAITARLNANKEKTRESLHIYIKITFDTDDKTFIFETVPNAAQDGFVKTYSDEDIANLLEESSEQSDEDLANWFEESDDQKDSGMICSSDLHTHKTRSCCSRITKFIGMSAIVFGLSYLAHSYSGAIGLSGLVDTETLGSYAEELAIYDYAGHITEFFKNLNVTQ